MTGSCSREHSCAIEGGKSVGWKSTVCLSRYRTRHFFNNSNINEDIATTFEQEYVRCVRNEKERVCSVCLHSEKIGVWCGMSRRLIIGPIFFDATITTAAYMEIFNAFVNQSK